jgi:hypothetical protein
MVDAKANGLELANFIGAICYRGSIRIGGGDTNVAGDKN